MAYGKGGFRRVAASELQPNYEEEASGKRGGPQLNEEITARQVLLVFPTPENGEPAPRPQVVDRFTALNAAKTLKLDLVCVAPEARPPVCKLINYTLEEYKRKMKAKERKASKPAQQIKGMRLKGMIEGHDLDRKLSKVFDYLGRGDKVKVTLGASKFHLRTNAACISELYDRIMHKLPCNNLTIVDDPTDDPKSSRGFVLAMKSAPLFEELQAGATQQVHQYVYKKKIRKQTDEDESQGHDARSSGYSNDVDCESDDG